MAVNAMTHGLMLSRLGLATALAMLTACSNGAPANAVAPSAIAESLPRAATDQGRVLTYYMDQIRQNPQDITALSQYTAELKGCKQIESAVLVIPLSASDVAKLGIERVRIWQRPGEYVRQTDTWSRVRSTQGESGPFKPGCNFSGLQEHSVKEILIPPHDAYRLDLTKGTGTYTWNDHLSLKRLPITSSDVGAGKGGLDELKLKKLDHSEALGQPCQVWSGGMAMGVTKDGMTTSGGKYEECDWAGGEKWGFSSGPLGQGGTIVLWRKMATDVPQRPGWVKTTAFDVGHLPSGSDAFEVPKNMPIRALLRGTSVPKDIPRGGK